MTTLQTPMQSIVGPYATALSEIRAHRGWFLAMGIILILCGMFALTWSFATAVVTAVVFGWLLIFTGLTQIIHTLVRRRCGSVAMHALIGALYVVVGFMTINQPAGAAVTLTLLIAVLLIIEGISRIIMAIAEPLPHRGWVLFNGAITLVLGLMIWRQWPSSALWVIGTFIGIELILNGWSFVMLSMAAKKFPVESSAAAPTTAGATA